MRALTSELVALELMGSRPTPHAPIVPPRPMRRPPFAVGLPNDTPGILSLLRRPR